MGLKRQGGFKCPPATVVLAEMTFQYYSADRAIKAELIFIPSDNINRPHNERA